jgi:hypothetical protein
VLIVSDAQTSFVTLFKLTDTSRNTPGLTGPFNVNTGSLCAVPAPAAQPGTTNVLDTLDTRFQAPGTQIGNALYQVHTCGPGLPRVEVLQLDFAANTLSRLDVLRATASSYDFNPSLATNDAGDVMVNWSSTDPPAGQQAGMLFAGKIAGETFGPLGLCFRSTTFSDAFRWGDTSGASVDPTDPSGRTFVISNETIQNAVDWGTRICTVTVMPR